MGRQRPTERRRTQRGSAILEGALVITAFALLLIGIADFGQLTLVHNALTERARSAVRYGAVQPTVNTTAVKNLVLYGQTSADGLTNTYFNLQPGNVTVSELSTGTDEHRLEVKISGHQFQAVSPYIYRSFTMPTIIATLPLGINN